MINLGFLLEFNLTFVILYLFYHTLLKAHTSAPVARGYLLLIAPISLLMATAELPLLPALELPAADFNFDMVPSTVASLSPMQEAMSTIDYLYIVYGIGVGVVALYFLYALLQITWLALRNPKNSTGIRFSQSRLGAAFSFFSLIFVDRKYENSKELPQLIAHEECHQKSFHSLDLLYAAVLCSLMWFNPAVWALFAALRFEHERQADSQVLRSGVEPMSYAKTILDAEVGFAPIVSSSLSYQLTKNRIKMMTKQTPKFASLRALLVLPIIALCAVLFTLTPATAQNKNDAKPNSPYYVVLSAEGKQIQAGYNVNTDNFQPESILSMNVIKKESVITDSYPAATDPSRGVVVITLKKETSVYLFDVTTDGEEATAVYVKAENGGVSKDGELKGEIVKFNLTTKSGASKYDDLEGEVVKVTLHSKSGSSKEGGKVISLEDNPPYYVIKSAEGKQLKAGYDVKISGIDPVTIASVSVIKDEAATSKEYPGATDPSRGVVVITLKAPKGGETQELAETMPKFQGGDIIKFRSWVAQNMKYPPQAKSAGTEGRAVVSFVIELDGTVSNVEVKRGADKLLDAEAVRVIASSPKWTPGENGGKKVRFTLMIPIDFKL